MADVAAKDASQETLSNFLALLLNFILVHIVTGNWLLIWLTFWILTPLHLYANWRAVRCLQFRTLNKARFHIIAQDWLSRKSTAHTEGPIISVQEVNRLESIVSIPFLTHSAVSVHLGCSFTSLSRAAGRVGLLLASKLTPASRVASSPTVNLVSYPITSEGCSEASLHKSSRVGLLLASKLTPASRVASSPTVNLVSYPITSASPTHHLAFWIGLRKQADVAAQLKALLQVEIITSLTSLPFVCTEVGDLLRSSQYVKHLPFFPHRRPLDRRTIQLSEAIHLTKSVDSSRWHTGSSESSLGLPFPSNRIAPSELSGGDALLVG
ncbi:unnamed protein product [Schistocephalus solidus]|uniref:Protein root UVB sensitive/RUS domain-containing protein n=1 Tax=Schistocephalus solidus TaxID=70667 RepID=A0A183TIG4_SCHSO|nr:unnamed protein product [Schistocephalus solidus]